MYEKGKVKLIGPDNDEFFSPIYDYNEAGKFGLVESGAYLPHSCDEWVIGGPAQIKALIEDLQVAFEALDRRKNKREEA